MPESIQPCVWAEVPQGVNLEKGTEKATLGDQVGDDPTLLVFLRHLG